MVPMCFAVLNDADSMALLALNCFQKLIFFNEENVNEFLDSVNFPDNKEENIRNILLEVMKKTPFWGKEKPKPKPFKIPEKFNIPLINKPYPKLNK